LRVTSPHFVIVGDAREGDLRAVARRLEQFREVFIRLLPKANAQTAVPTLVVWCSSGTALEVLAGRGPAVEVIAA
jgi:hypothetical protein